VEDIIKDFILSGCYGDSLEYRKKHEHKVYSESQGQWSYIVEIMIVTIKSLLPSSKVAGTLVDYKRFDEEIKLWKDYRHDENNSLIEVVDGQSEKDYWTNLDDSLYSRIVPLVMVNSDWQIVKVEVIKNILYTTGNIEALLEGIILAKILHSYIINESIELEKLSSDLKEEVIHLSQKELLEKFRDYYRFDLKSFPGNFTIVFERNRVELLNILSGKDSSKYKIFMKSLAVIKGNAYENESFYNFFINGLVGAKYGYDIKKDFKDKEFIESLCSYIYKLFKSRVNPESLEIATYYLPDIFKFKEGEEFSHSLLNRCKVIKKEIDDSNITSYIKTKAGTYRFFRIK